MSMTERRRYRFSQLGFALLVASSVILMAADSVIARDVTAPTSAQEISITDAKILLYVSPIGESMRAGGSDIAMERQTSAKLNQKDYYFFWVYDSRRRSSGSVTVGYYAVNKHTAGVWDMDENKQLSGRLLLGVQKLFRESHRIDDVTIKKYSANPLYVVE